MAESAGRDVRHQCLKTISLAHKRMKEGQVMGSVQGEVGGTKSRDCPLVFYVEQEFENETSLVWCWIMQLKTRERIYPEESICSLVLVKRNVGSLSYLVSRHSFLL